MTHNLFFVKSQRLYLEQVALK